MKYYAVIHSLTRHKFHLFTLKDIETLFPAENKKTIKNNITSWLSKGYFVRLKRGLYELAEPGSDRKIPDLYVANRLYEPSYVSLETALSMYSIIPEVAGQVTSVTSRLTRTFKNKYGSFFYRSCKGKAFTGYMLTGYDGFKVRIANKEKALVDFLYFRLRSGYSIDFSEERLNKKILTAISWKKVLNYAGVFNKKTVTTLKKCEEYVKC